MPHNQFSNLGFILTPKFHKIDAVSQVMSIYSDQIAHPAELGIYLFTRNIKNKNI